MKPMEQVPGTVYIVLGDNVDESKDSRYEVVGVVMGEDVLGEIK